MFIGIKDLVGSKRNISAKAIYRFRPTFGDSEPMDATMIDLVTKRIYSRTDPKKLLSKIEQSNPMALLTTPVGLPVWVSADRVIDVAKPIKNLHHDKAKAVVTIHVHGNESVDQQVTETVQRASKIISQSL